MSVSSPGQKKVAATGGELIIEQGNNRIIVFNGTNYRAVFGVLPDGTINLVISKPNADVFEALAG